MNESRTACRRVRSAAFGPIGLVLTLVLVGCGGGDRLEGDETSPGGAEPVPSQSASTTPRPTPTPSPTPTLREAADGRNLDACLDRDCEVEVREGDTIRFAPEFVTNTFAVDQLTDEQVHVTVTDDEPSPLSGWIGGNGEIESGDIHVDITRTDDGGCILTFSPR